METKRQDVNEPFIPEDIIFFEIFSRLPVKSVHRFRCVSMSCRFLTTDPRFQAAYRSRSPHRYLISFWPSVDMQNVFYAVNPESDRDGNSESNQIDYLDRADNVCFAYFKSVNGLTCFMNDETLFVCNVATNEKIVLPQILSQSPSERHFIHFCHDPETNKYKVLKATCLRILVDGNLKTTATDYSIFTLGVDDSWRNLNNPGLYQLKNSKSVCLDGVLVCTNFSTSINVQDGVIAAFLVGSECFRVISYPKELPSSRHSSCHIIELMGRVAILEMKGFYESYLITMWIDEGGFDFDSKYWWTKHYRIWLPLEWSSIVHVTHHFSYCGNGNGEIVISLSHWTSSSCWLFIYDVKKTEWRKIKVLGMPKHLIFGDFLIEDYVDSPLMLRDI